MIQNAGIKCGLIVFFKASYCHKNVTPVFGVTEKAQFLNFCTEELGFFTYWNFENLCNYTFYPLIKRKENEIRYSYTALNRIC